MRLKEYLAQPNAKSLHELSEESGVSYLTCKSVARGMLLANYKVAKRLSEATKPKGRVKCEPLVTIDDLCAEETR